MHLFMSGLNTKHMGGTMRLGGSRTVLQVRCVVGRSVCYNWCKQVTKHMWLFMPEISTKHMGGTMRLGGRRTVLQVRCVVRSSVGTN
jgi:CTP synthase (UTP-ammonia lyase)